VATCSKRAKRISNSNLQKIRNIDLCSNPDQRNEKIALLTVSASIAHASAVSGRCATKLRRSERIDDRTVMNTQQATQIDDCDASRNTCTVTNNNYAQRTLLLLGDVYKVQLGLSYSTNTSETTCTSTPDDTSGTAEQAEQAEQSTAGGTADQAEQVTASGTADQAEQVTASGTAKRAEQSTASGTAKRAEQ
jgi:hypothetical protein